VVASAAVVLSTIIRVKNKLRIRALERSFWVSIDITWFGDGSLQYNAFVVQFVEHGPVPLFLFKKRRFSERLNEMWFKTFQQAISEKDPIR